MDAFNLFRFRSTRPTNKPQSSVRVWSLSLKTIFDQLWVWRNARASLNRVGRARMWTPACSQLRLPVSDWGRPAAHSSYASLNWPSRCSRTYAPKRPFHCTHHTLTGPGGQQVSVKKNVPRKCRVNALPVWRSHPVISKSARASTKKKSNKTIVATALHQCSIHFVIF